MRAPLWPAFVLLAACSGTGAPEAPPSAPPSTEASALVEAEPAAEAAPGPAIEEPAPPPVVASTHELLVLLVSQGPLLPSEERLGEFLATRMRRNHRDVELRPATDDEAVLATAALAHDPVPAAPDTFGAARRVLFLRFAPPRSLPEGDLRSRGVDGVVLLRPPAATPAFEARLADGWRLENDAWADWLSGLLRDAEGT